MKVKPIAWAFGSYAMGWQLCSEELFNNRQKSSASFDWVELYPFYAEEVEESAVARAYEDGFVKGYAAALTSCADKNILIRKAA